MASASYGTDSQGLRSEKHHFPSTDSLEGEPIISEPVVSSGSWMDDASPGHTRSLPSIQAPMGAITPTHPKETYSFSMDHIF